MARGRTGTRTQRRLRLNRENREAGRDQQRADAATEREQAQAGWGSAATARLFDVTVWPGMEPGTIRVDVCIAATSELETRTISTQEWREVEALRKRVAPSRFYDNRRTA